MEVVFDETDAEREERERAFAECMENRPPPPPVADAEGNEVVTWEQALGWWAFDPLLHWASPGEQYETAVVAWSETGGRQGDPREEDAYLSVIYQRPGATVQSSNGPEITRAGGIGITTRPPSADGWNFPEAGARTVIVRGQPASLFYQEYRDGTRIRVLMWNEPTRDGTATLPMLMGSSPEHMSDDEAVRWANELQPRR